jgi:pyruvate/2-oxoglutarate dehydrogenase complex dihydrolipoamide acyltransferase (E2) component
MDAEYRLPDLDLPGVPIVVSAWHADAGQHVVEGDRLIEVTAGDVTVDLAAPTSGMLVERCAKIDQPLEVGQLLAKIRPD